MRIPVLILILSIPLFLEAQPLFGKFPVSSGIPVFSKSGALLEFPFAGGLNNCQYGQMDIDLDGNKDLVVFDRHGNRILCFVNKGFPDSIAFDYRPELASQFPVLKEWMILKDYNNDGKEDIFTYTTGGIKAYLNTSVTTLSFRQVSFPYLVSLQGITNTNILVTYADYPAIEDVDEDGDVDILTFKGLGSFIEWHQNMSIEQYGIPDSLVFERVSNCWGHFAEGGESNVIRLDTCFESKNDPGTKNDPKHTGSTLLLSDFSGNSLKDLVVGDVDFSGVILLTNGGTLTDAYMTDQTAVFPVSTHPVNLPSFPVVCKLDINNDLTDDLLVSSFDPGLVKSQNLNSSWLYLGESNHAYSFSQPDFLQGQMLDFGSGAYPAFFDYNSDGLTDLIIGNYGRLDTCLYTPQTGLQCAYISTLTLLENTGSVSQPSFQVKDEDFLGLSVLEMQSLVPAFGDLDNDGDMDLVCGNSKGKFVYLENIATFGQPAVFMLSDPAFQQLDAGDFSAPCLVDLDKDGLTDIISGRRDGRISYFKNMGPSENPVFQHVTDSLGGIDVTDTGLSYYGYSVPYLYESSGGQSYLLVGSEFGEILVFDSIQAEEDRNFHDLGRLNMSHTGLRSAVAVSMLNGDTVPDLLIGNYCGGLNLHEGITTTLGTDPNKKINVGLKMIPNPARQTTRIILSDVGSEGPAIIQIYRPDARLLSVFKIEKLPYDLDVSSLQVGVYLVQVTVPGLRATGKLVVVR